MKGIILAAALLLCFGCTTLQPGEAPPEEVQRMIREDNLVEKGDRVRLVTVDGVVHKFRVVAVNREEGRVYGKKESVLIADIIALETAEVSIGKTAALTGGIVAGWAILLMLAAPAFILAGA